MTRSKKILRSKKVKSPLQTPKISTLEKEDTTDDFNLLPVESEVTNNFELKKIDKMESLLKHIKFSGENGLNLENLFKLLERTFTAETTNEKKIEILITILEKEALCFFINSCVDCQDFAEIKNKFLRRYPQKDISLTTFNQCRYTNKETFEAYCTEKINLGRNLQLQEKLIIEGINETVPQTMRMILSTQQFNVAEEYVKTAKKVLENIKEDNANEEEIKKEPIPENESRDRQPSYERKQWIPRHPASFSHRGMMPQQPRFQAPNFQFRRPSSPTPRYGPPMRNWSQRQIRPGNFQFAPPPEYGPQHSSNNRSNQ